MPADRENGESRAAETEAGRAYEPAKALLAAVQDAWIAGLTGLAAGFGPQAPHTQATTADNGAPANDSRGTELMRQAGGAGGFAPHLAEAALACMSSGARFWAGVAEVYGRHQATFVGSMINRAQDSQLAADQRLILADEIQNYLRELGDVSLREARYLQVQLAQVGERVARAAETPDVASEYRRFWKSKP